jgi:hypothetical protein
MRCCGVPSTYWECPGEGGGSGGIQVDIIGTLRELWEKVPYKQYVILLIVLVVLVRLLK